MNEVLQLVNELNKRERAGGPLAEIMRLAEAIGKQAPGWVVLYWREMKSWVLIPREACPEYLRPKGEVQG